MMELNAKSPFVWDWENLVMFSSKAVEAPKTFQLVDTELDAMDGFEAVSLYPSGGRSEVGSGGSGFSSGSGSDLGYGSSSKSSKSASDYSSTNREIRPSKSYLDTNDCSPEGTNCKRALGNAWQSNHSSKTVSPIHSGESLIGLKLGRRTYFEDVSAGNNGNKTAAPVPVPPVNATGKKSKLSTLSSDIVRCQVEGCGLDLSSAKVYHRKHRVCGTHSRSPRVVVAGIERRFCQQCSRFHSLSEFDQNKRSCRRRLSDHNARRRKPKPEIIQFNSMRLPSSLYDGRHKIAFNQAPMVQQRSDAGSGWDFSAASKVLRAKVGLLNGTKSESHITSYELQKSGGVKNHLSTELLPSKGGRHQVFPEGLPVSSTAQSNIDATQNLRALSLLSTSSWGSSQPTLAPLNQPMLGNNRQTGVSNPLPNLHPMSSLGLPAASSGYWHNDQQPVTTSSGLNVSASSHKTGGHFEDFQLFKEPSGANYYQY